MEYYAAWPKVTVGVGQGRTSGAKMGRRKGAVAQAEHWATAWSARPQVCSLLWRNHRVRVPLYARSGIPETWLLNVLG